MSQDPPARGRPPAITRGELSALALLVLIGAVLRSYRLGDWPPGFHVDEAFNLVDARAMIQTGWRPVFLPANAGRDVLYSYLQAPLLWILGESVAHARLASALIGTLSIPLFWLTARMLLAGDPALPPERLRRLALLAAGLASLSLWHLHFSRFGIRAVLFPAVVSGVVLAWWVAVREGEGAGAGRRWLPPALLLGLAFYTHPAGRALVLLPAAHALYLARRRRDRRPLLLLARAFGGALLMAAPLLVFWWRHPATFSSHAGEVSILGQGWRAVWDNLLRVLGMFTVAGDGKPWRNWVNAAGQGRPVFGWGPGSAAPGGVDLFFGLLLPLTGLIVWLAAIRQGRPWAVLGGLWLLVLLLPSVSTDQAPNLSRSIGALPPVFLLLACGLEWFPGGLRGRLDLQPQDGLEAGLWNLAAAAFLALFGYQSWRDYRAWMEAPQTPLAFDADKVALAAHINAERASGGEVYLTPAMAAHPTVRSLVKAPVRGFDAQYGFVLPPAETPRVSYLFLGAEGLAGARYGCSNLGIVPHIGPIEQRGLQLQDVAELWPATPVLDLRGCRAERPTDHLAQLEFSVDEQDLLGGKVGFSGLTLYTSTTETTVVGRGRELLSSREFRDLLRIRPDGQVWLQVIWRVLASPPPDLNVAIQLVDDAGRPVAQADGPPLGPPGGSSSYPSELWRPGETVITEHEIMIPADAPPGMVTLRVGLYDWRSGTPLLSKAGESVLPVLRWRVGGAGD